MYLARAKKRGLDRHQFTFIIKDDVPGAKKGLVRFAGADRIDPGHKHNPIQFARDLGGGGWLGDHWGIGPNNTVNPDQYACPYTYTHYEGWASEKIVRYGGEFDDLIVPVGTGSTLIGLRRGIHALTRGKKPVIVGALCADGVEIPGMRDLKRMELVRHPWKEAADVQIEVTRKPAFLCAAWVSWDIDSNVAPSGGAAYVATCLYLQGLLDAGENLKGRRVLFVIHDEASQYVGDRLDEFPAKEFYMPTATVPRELIFGKQHGA